MTSSTKDTGALSGSREPSQSSLSRPHGFDPARKPVWQATLDGIYDCCVVRLSPSLGELRVARTSGEPIASGRVMFSYQAAFGPDVDDVADWQAWVMEFFEGEIGARNPLKAIAMEAAALPRDEGLKALG